MDTVWLEDFLAVIRHGGFSRAAEQRAISQPAFSRRIKSLEDWVGAPLFDRNTHAVGLTPAGERLRPFAEDVLRQLETGRRDAANAAQTVSETLLFASTQALSLTFFPPWLRALERQAPLVTSVQLTAASMVACERLMIDGLAQFLLCHHHPAASTALTRDRFRSIALGKDVLVPVAAPTLASPRLFKEGPYLAYSSDSGVGRILAATWEEAGRPRPPEPIFSSHLATVLAMMARDGRGLAWSPLSLVCDDLAVGRLVQLGDASHEVHIAIHLFRAKARQAEVAERFWQRIADANRQEKNANNSDSVSSGHSS